MTIIEDLRAKGYVILRSVLSAETLSAVTGFLAGVVDDHLAAISALPDKENRSFAESQLGTGHFSLETRLSETLHALPRDASLRAALESVFGMDALYMHMPPTARFVVPGNLDAAVPPHQDRPYNEHLPEFLTVWVPLVEIDEQCGGVAVYPGSQDAAVDTGERTNVWYDAVPTDGYTPVHCAPMSPGDVLIMLPATIHKSMPNLSQTTRISVDMRFFGTPVSGKHFLDMQSWKVREPTKETV